MENTKIDWCDSTWNPVTGCLHGCEYCYAKRIARRFGDSAAECGTIRNQYVKLKDEPYPYGFDPTFHRYRLDRPKIWTKARNIFVCSMADLFGEWVPDKWIEKVFDACDKAPQHNYLFLTKNPDRYDHAIEDNYKNYVVDHMKNFWFGTTVTNDEDLLINGRTLLASVLMNCDKAKTFNHFLSIEPLLEEITQLQRLKHHDWIIVGAETGRRKNKVILERKWIDDIVSECRKENVPLFMKSSLTEIWGEPLIQEFPEGLRK